MRSVPHKARTEVKSSRVPPKMHTRRSPSQAGAKSAAAPVSYGSSVSSHPADNTQLQRSHNKEADEAMDRLRGLVREDAVSRARCVGEKANYQSHIARDCVLQLQEMQNQPVWDESCMADHLRYISEMCYGSRAFTHFQNHAVYNNIVPLLVSISRDAHTFNCKSAAFQALGELCFSNEFTSAVIGRDKVLIEGVRAILSDKQIGQRDANIQGWALFPVSNAALNFTVHDELINLAPCAVELFHSTTKDHIKGQAVKFLTLLSYNEKCRQALIECGSLHPLLTSVNSKRHALYPAAAAVGLACLVGHLGDQAGLQMSSLMLTQILDALDATLKGGDFPEGSDTYFCDWKLMSGVLNLCRSPANVARIDTKRIIALLTAATEKAVLDNPRGDLLMQNSLKALWLISQHDNTSCGQKEADLNMELTNDANTQGNMVQKHITRVHSQMDIT